MMEYYAGGDTVYYMLAIPTLPTDAEDDYHAAYDKDTDRLYWKADAGAAGGDSISIDSVAVVDPDFQDTATINITDTVNVVTMDIIADSVDSAHYAAGSIDYEHLADDVISGAAAVGTFTSGDTFLVLEAGVGLREADYDDLPGAGATAYNSIGDPTGAGSISFDAAETAEYTSAFTANDFMTIKGTGAFGDFSVLTITQDTGNPIDGDLIHAYTADAEDDVDQLVLGNGLDDYVTFRVLEAGTFTIDVTSDGVAAVVIPDAITANGGITSSGTIEAATLTEGGTGVPNTGDNLSVFAATTSAQLYGVLSDETGSAAGAPLAVFNQAPTIDSPTFTTAITATDLIDSAHYVAASIDNEHLADNAVDSAELAAGSVDDAHIADDTIQEPALNTTNAAGAGTDNYLLSYNHAGTNFTWVLAGAGDMLKATYDSGDSGGVDVLTTVDSIYASDYVLLTGTAVGTAAPKTDGALTYDATSGTLAATEFSGGGSGLTLASTDLTDTADIIYEAEIDTFAELDTQVADKALVNKADGAVWLGVHDFGGGDLEIPQASPAVPAADGGIEVDFTDGKLIMQHGSAHAELAGATDVAMGTLIKSWSATIFEPDSVNDVLTVKAINSIEFPHGVVITAIYLGVSSDTGYVLTVQNFDDFDTINAANGTIDTVTYSTDATGEIIDSTPTYATIAAGQIIMVSIPATDVDWIHFEIYYYEPAAG
jgi:hypothetical protein